jgi:hypothetical protein
MRTFELCYALRLWSGIWSGYRHHLHRGSDRIQSTKNSAQISARKRRSIASIRPLHDGAAAVTLTNSFVRLTPGINGKFKTL